MTSPDFRSAEFLHRHARWIMSFYEPRAIDPSGGMYHFFLDDGTVYDRHTRHLVSATRFVVTYSMIYHLSREPIYRQGVVHAVRFLRDVFRDPANGGYAWQLRWDGRQAEVQDATRHAYGMAFVMLSFSHALLCGIDEAREWLLEVESLFERHFWQSSFGLYADEATPDWQLSAYRGQNSNMHACEAMLQAFIATGEQRFIKRADMVAQSVTCRLASQTNNLIWEHYRQDWSVDWEYNRHDVSNIFRPWGYQPGHLAEWAKLLVQIEALHPLPTDDPATSWRLSRAGELFQAAIRHGWDHEHGGIHYGFAPDLTICYPDKYHWVQSEALAAAALLALHTGDASYWVWYDRLWEYCWAHFVDHQHGAWFRILDRTNLNHTREKSPAGKVDYHTIGACFDIISALKRRPRQGTSG